MQPMTYEEYLAHHGILGMRWGKRNGPPYPLNEDQMTSKERAKNEVSEYAAKAYVARKKAKIREKELVRKHKFEEKEARRQNRVDERESRRQNRVDEREIERQNRVDEKEASKQNEFDSQEKWEQYKRGRTYVRKFLIGAGVMTVAGLAAYKMVKGHQVNVEAAKKAAQTVANRANAADAAKSIREVAQKTTGSSPVITPPTSSRMQSTFKYISDAQAKGLLGKGAKSTSKILKNVPKAAGSSVASYMPPGFGQSSMQKAMNWINKEVGSQVIGPYVLNNPYRRR